MIRCYENQTVLVVGLKLSGTAAVEFLLYHGATVWGFDDDANLLASDPNVQCLKGSGLRLFSKGETIPWEQISLMVISPGVPPHHASCIAASRHKIPIIGEIELAARVVSQPFLGITGTNGKTTVTLLVTHILNASGKPARAVGNVGNPLAAALLTKSDDILVVELSSYQLETLRAPVMDAAVLLNITPDHLDRYPSMEAYADTKWAIGRSIKESGTLYVEEHTAKAYASHVKEYEGQLQLQTFGFSPGCTIRSDKSHLLLNERIEYILPLGYRGLMSHDVENLLAAYALCHEMGVTPEQFVTAAETFKKPAHRVEFVRTSGGVAYYDDSKGTNVDAVIKAVHSLTGPVILIAGGVDKGFPYTGWIDPFEGKVRHICAIGEASIKIKRDLSKSFSVEIFDSLESAIKHAQHMAKKGDNVLLSPGCASFDMFKDYAHRGNEFKRLVHELDS